MQARAVHDAWQAYREYFALPTGLGDPRGAFAAERRLCEHTLEEVRGLKQQLLELLAELRLVSTRMRELGDLP